MPGRIDPDSLGKWMNDVERRMRVMERGSGVRETGTTPQ